MRTAKRFDEFLQRLAAAAVPKRRTWMKPDMRAVDSVRLLAELVPQWRLSIQTRAPAARGSHTVWLNAKHVRSFELCECFRWAVDCATPLRLAEVIAGPLSLLLGANVVQHATCIQVKAISLDCFSAHAAARSPNLPQCWPHLAAVEWSLGAPSHGETHAATQAQVGEALRLVSLCDGQIIAGVTDGIIGFVWVTVHHVTVLRKIFARTAAGTAHELGLPALLRNPASSCWADDVDQEYGLHGYTVHVSLRTAATELYAETFRHVAARGGQSASAVVNFGLCNADAEPALMRRIGGALRLPWRTACMNGVATRAVLVDVTVFDEAMVPRIYCTRLGLLEPPSPSQAAVRSLGFPGLLCVKEAQWSLRLELLVLHEHIDGPGTFSKDSTACFVTRACLEARVS